MGPLALTLRYDGNRLDGVLGSEDSPAKLGFLEFTAEKLMGHLDGQSMRLGGTATAYDGAGCQSTWRVALDGQLAFDGFEGTLTHEALSGSSGSACEGRGSCTTVQLASAVRTSYGSKGDPRPGSGGMKQYE